MAVDVTTSPTFRAGETKLLFRVPDTFPLLGVFPREGTNFPDCSCGTAVACEQGSIGRDGEHCAFILAVPPLRNEVKLAPEILAKYTGTYTLSGTDMVLFLEGTQLMFQAGHGDKASLFAESESGFFLKATNGEIEFFKDDKGQPSYFFFYRGGVPRLAIPK